MKNILSIMTVIFLVSCTSTPSRKLAGLSGPSLDLSKLEDIVTQSCENFKRLKKKEVENLQDHDRSAYEQYMSCKNFKKHENRDHFGRCEKIDDDSYAVTGKISYGSKISPYLGPYRYDVLTENDEIKIQVRIHYDSKLLSQTIQKKDFPEEFKEGIDSPINNYGELIDFYLVKAASLWTTHSPLPNIIFEFKRVNEKTLAHFSVKYVDKEKSVLYNKFWSTDAKELEKRDSKKNYYRIFSHEIGHMMGLEDEINRTKGLLNGGYFMWKDGFPMDCSSASLMCVSVVKFTTAEPIPLPYHYFQIFRRINKCVE